MKCSPDMPEVGEGRASARLQIHGSPALILSVAAAIYAVRTSRPVLVPVFVSILASYALRPPVALLTARGRLPRLAAVALVYAALGAGILAVGRTAVRDAASFVDSLPENVAALQESLARPRPRTIDAATPIRNIQAAVAEMKQAVPAPQTPGVRRVIAVQPPFDLHHYLLEATVGALGTTSQLIAVAMMTFVLLVGGDAFKRKVVRWAGPEWSEKRLTVEVMHSIDQQIERYLVVRVLISAIVAAATAIVLWLVGLSHPVSWGVVAGVLNVMPFIGPTIAVVLVALAAVIQFHTVGLTAAAAAGATVVAAFEGNVLTPWLTSRAGELNTVAVFVGVLFWGWMWDVWGLILAVPILVAAKAAADRIEPLQSVGELLGR